MKSVLQTVIIGQPAKLAEFYANPKYNTKWMHEVERCEYISGDPNMPGFKYRLVPRKGDLEFITTVISRNLPTELKLLMEAPNVTVRVTGKFVALSPEKTRLISKQVFLFKGFFNKLYGFLAQRAIRKAHRRHLNNFKKLAEQKEL